MADTPIAPDDLPDGLLVLSADGTVVSVNAVGRRLLGLDPSSIGRPVTDVVRLLDEQGNDWWSCSRPLLGLPSVQRQPERRLVLAGPDDTGRDLLVSTRYVRDQGVLRAVVVAIRDTAARERLERSRADLVTMVAHELRSPLASVRGFTSTLLSRWERFSDEQKKVMLATVDADAGRVTRLLSELLDVSRIDAGRLELHRQVVDVVAAVRRVVEGKVAAGEPADRFVVVSHGQLPEIWLDPDKLDQILHNLVDNALRHGAGVVTVSVGPPDPLSTTQRETVAEQGVEIRVTDQGDGIPEDKQSLIFARFWRASTRRDGTGLGLYIVKGLVEAHGGTVVADRGPDGGACFRVTLPVGTPAFM